MTRPLPVLFVLLASSPSVALADGASPPIRPAAEEASEINPPPEEADRPRAPGSHRLSPFVNEGLYLRMAVGFGTNTDVITTTSSANEDTRSDVTGIGSAGEILVGGPVAPRLILGGALWASTTSTSSYYYGGGVQLPEDMQRPRDFVMVGPFVDWYFLDSVGLHLEGGLGFATLMAYGWSHGSDRGRAAFGGGAVVGFGYDTWIAEHWKVGATARLTSAVLAQREAGVTWIHSTTQFPALLVSATYD